MRSFFTGQLPCTRLYLIKYWLLESERAVGRTEPGQQPGVSTELGGLNQVLQTSRRGVGRGSGLGCSTCFFLVMVPKAWVSYRHCLPALTPQLLRTLLRPRTRPFVSSRAKVKCSSDESGCHLKNQWSIPHPTSFLLRSQPQVLSKVINPCIRSETEMDN